MGKGNVEEVHVQFTVEFHYPVRSCVRCKYSKSNTIIVVTVQLIDPRETWELFRMLCVI